MRYFLKSVSVPFMILVALTAAALAAAHFLPQQLTGSFEYIRKGDELVGKGKYQKALTFYEKAYEESPDSDAIRSALVWAYSTYSQELIQQKKYDAAIECMQKAYDVSPNSSTAQNLAMSLSAKALAAAKKGSIAEAKELYTKARFYAARSGIVSRNLGVMLYNDGVEEFRSGREDIAVLCLKESSLSYKDARIYELLGDLYYKAADLKSARISWHMAASLDTKSADLKEKMRKVIKEMSLSARERTEDITHFEITYIKDLPVDKYLTERTLEMAYADIGKDLGYFPDVKTKVFIYSREDFKNTFGMPYFVKAFYDGSIKMPAPSTRLDRDKFADYIYHEYTHALVGARTNNNCPAWFSEGIAVWEESKRSRADVGGLLKNIRTLSDLSFKFLEDSFKTDEISADKALSYVISYTLVEFIIDRWSIKGLQGVLKRLSTKQHVVNAIDDEFLISEKQFEKEWRDYASKRFF
jgi:tetratricopeptide (TPR) repeat protein